MDKLATIKLQCKDWIYGIGFDLTEARHNSKVEGLRGNEALKKRYDHELKILNGHVVQLEAIIRYIERSEGQK